MSTTTRSYLPQNQTAAAAVEPENKEQKTSTPPVSATIETPQQTTHTKALHSTLPVPGFTKLLSFSIMYIVENRTEEIANLRHFCANGIYVNDLNVDYWIVLTTSDDVFNSESLRAALIAPLISSSVQAADNVKIMWHKNLGTDLCVFALIMQNSLEWKQAVMRMDPVVSDRYYYSHFWFMNGTVRGPFLPLYMWRTGLVWWEYFIRLMEMSPKVDAVGCYASCNPSLHLQSMAMMLNRAALAIANSTFYCQHVGEKRYPWILNTEVKFTTNLLAAGLNARSMLGIWNSLDARAVHALSKEARNAVHVCESDNPFVNGYSGIYALPAEVMFFKMTAAMRRYVPKYALDAFNVAERLQRNLVGDHTLHDRR